MGIKEKLGSTILVGSIILFSSVGINGKFIANANDLSNSNGVTQEKYIIDSSVEPMKYYVRSGDSIANIAKVVGIEPKWIIESNLGIIQKNVNINATGFVREGQKILIPRIPGIAYQVSEGDNIESLLEKFMISKELFLQYNGNKEITEGSLIMFPVPDFYLPADKQGNNKYGFYWGNCTWYVASKLKGYINWNGNANQWINNAKRNGNATGNYPIKGAIVQFGGPGISSYGHVAYVENVKNDGTFDISEMNYKGLGVKSYRTLGNYDSSIKGFIYVGNAKKEFLKKEFENKLLSSNIKNSERIK